ncbi:uncharacterized protein LOC126076297 [Elephas maximus indicus]|uniref:uncharacterized protein LOC126076297 n=1 Tax=Elephas maximus indicus TaxID=99487 RepID=UPI002116CA02|nr:uncharacterized protein LOC126076297 [Elephas maximus indicus]
MVTSESPPDALSTSSASHQPPTVVYSKGLCVCHSCILRVPFPIAPSWRQPLAGSQLCGVSSSRGVSGGGGSNPELRKPLRRLRLALPGSFQSTAEGNERPQDPRGCHHRKHQESFEDFFTSCLTQSRHQKRKQDTRVKSPGKLAEPTWCLPDPLLEGLCCKRDNRKHLTILPSWPHLRNVNINETYGHEVGSDSLQPHTQQKKNLPSPATDIFTIVGMLKSIVVATVFLNAFQSQRPIFQHYMGQHSVVIHRVCIGYFLK